MEDDAGERWRVLDVARRGHLTHAARPLRLDACPREELAFCFLRPPNRRAVRRWFVTANRRLRVLRYPGREVSPDALRAQLAMAQRLVTDLQGGLLARGKVAPRVDYGAVHLFGATLHTVRIDGVSVGQVTRDPNGPLRWTCTLPRHRGGASATDLDAALEAHLRTAR